MSESSQHQHVSFDISDGSTHDDELNGYRNYYAPLSQTMNSDHQTSPSTSPDSERDTQHAISQPQQPPPLQSSSSYYIQQQQQQQSVLNKNAADQYGGLSMSHTNEIIDQSKSHDSEQVVESSENQRYVRLNTLLGKGAYKVVYKAIDREEGYEVAWNTMQVKIEMRDSFFSQAVEVVDNEKKVGLEGREDRIVAK